MRRSRIRFAAWIVLGLIVFLWLVKAPVISLYMSHALRLPVSMDWISMGTRKMLIHDFAIANPRGFSDRAALKAQKTWVDYKLDTFSHRPFTLDSIVMQNVVLEVEVLNASGSDNNWTVLSDRMKAPSPRSKGVLVRKLILENVTILVTGDLSMGPIHREIDRLEFDNISSDNGFPTEAFVHQIFGGAGIDGYIQDAFNPGTWIEGVVSPFRSL